MKKLYKNIFIVDDNSNVLRLLEEAFKDNEFIHKIKGFSKGSTFLKYIKRPSFLKEKPDLIMLDLYMPEYDGFTIAKQIRENTSLKNTPIVMLSESKNQNDVYESYNFGANLFLEKPGTYQAWIELIRTVDKVWLEDVKE